MSVFISQLPSPVNCPATSGKTREPIFSGRKTSRERSIARPWPGGRVTLESLLHLIIAGRVATKVKAQQGIIVASPAYWATLRMCGSDGRIGDNPRHGARPCSAGSSALGRSTWSSGRDNGVGGVYSEPGPEFRLGAFPLAKSSGSAEKNARPIPGFAFHTLSIPGNMWRIPWLKGMVVLFINQLFQLEWFSCSALTFLMAPEFRLRLTNCTACESIAILSVILRRELHQKFFRRCRVGYNFSNKKSCNWKTNEDHQQCHGQNHSGPRYIYTAEFNDQEKPIAGAF